ncbi:hypothetical protein FACS189427_11570 [Planctomycetales bacterium]|nr:hypothetical protein FACS189427_11570 [Planctomycetales bacterium]
MQGLRNLFTKTEAVITNNWYPVTLGLFSFPFWCLLVAVFGFIVFIPVSKYHAIVAFLLALGTIAWACEWNVKRSVILSAVFCGLLFLALLPTAFVFENDCDTWWVNHLAAIPIAQGWNPLYQFQSPTGTWATHYPKGDRIINAVLYSFTGNLQSGNLSQILFPLLVFPFCCCALPKIFSLAKWKNLLLSLYLAFNPVLLSQFFIGKEDGIFTACLTILFFGLIAYLKSKDNRFFPFIIGSIIVATNVKFTGVVYVAVFLITVLLPLLITGIWNKNPLNKKLTGVLVLATALSLTVGFNPYLYNVYHHISPFHPVITVKEEEKRDFPRDQHWYEQPDFIKANKFERFAFYHLNPFKRGGSNSRKEPFTAYPIFNLYAMPLLFSFFMFPFIRNKYVWLLFIGSCLSIASQPHSWIFRYVPQLWFIPVIVIASLWETTEALSLWKKRYNVIATLIILFCISQGNTSFLDAARYHYVYTIKSYASILQYKDDMLSISPCKPYLHYNGDYSMKHSLIPDCFPNIKINCLEYKEHIENISIRYAGYIPVYLSPDVQPLPKMTRRDLPQMVKLILQLRLRQFKRVWGLEQPPIPVQTPK